MHVWFFRTVIDAIDGDKNKGSPHLFLVLTHNEANEDERAISNEQSVCSNKSLAVVIGDFDEKRHILSVVVRPQWVLKYVSVHGSLHCFYFIVKNTIYKNIVISFLNFMPGYRPSNCTNVRN